MKHKVNFKEGRNKYTKDFIDHIGKPICLKSNTGNNLQNEFFWRSARCNNANTEGWEQMILIKTNDDKIIIQSRWNNRNLQVQESGRCVFANSNQDLWEKFDVEVDDDGKVYFISCHTGNVMQCNDERFAWCSNQNRLSWEAWTITHPNSKIMMTSSNLRAAATGAVLEIVMCSLVPLVSGGCAALLQASSAALLTGNAAVIGAATEAVAGTAVNKKKFYCSSVPSQLMIMYVMIIMMIFYVQFLIM